MMQGGGMMGMGEMMGGGGMFFGPLILIGFFVLIIASVVLFAGWTGRGHMTPRATDRTPLDILQERLARGDIDMREYGEKLRVLVG